MRRLLTLASLLALALVALAVGSGAQGSSTARFDVIFDDAHGLVSGQVVKVAGAQVGKIVNIVLTPDFKARIEAEVDSGFMPFRANATCTIRPEGLISENYLECDPGRPPAPILRGGGGHPPTVPVSNVTEPVSLTDLFNIFNVPTQERFTVLLDELGMATAGRGQDLNDILRRANPTLSLARQTIAILARQRAQLGGLVDATNTIAAEGAGHTAALQSFITRAADVSAVTAAHRRSLSLAVARLPGLLAAAQPTLQELDTVATGGTPLLEQLQASAPSLNRVAGDLGPFVSAARPALARLRSTLKQTIPTLRAIRPLVREVRAYSGRSLAGDKLSGRLYTSLQQAGFPEDFLGTIYYVGAALSRYDGTSHLLDITLDSIENNACGNYATTPVAGCGANFGSPPASSAHDRPAARPPAAAPRARSGAATGGQADPGRQLHHLANYLLR